METEIKEIEIIFFAEIKEINSLQDLEKLRIKYLGRKGILDGLFSQLSHIESSQRPLLGKMLNELKEKILKEIKEKENLWAGDKELAGIDLSLPGLYFVIGKKHILTQTIEEVLAIFEKLGFTILEGPEIETEYYNFTSLNIPQEHPATEAFHTFYLEGEISSGERRPRSAPGKGRYLLRSQTSTVQVRVMENYLPPLRIISPGRVYRPDAVDASHSFMFHQIEGFAVDENIKFSDLKGTIFVFAQRFFGKEIKMRFRPHYFPFTEPSVEVDISCIICQRNQKPETSNQKCGVCKGKGWLEILGAGMIHPRVFHFAGYPKHKYTGFAFGMGVERMAMLKYGIEDIRLFFENDLRFLRQF
ncbi:MAG: phenylalanine--tRNA ligase subunit alpha [Candidatus Omnitrophica bacterium]|nr:phenylalanine--tRNA ligase subunit alpha [Candidatus Omnitrophota bacterium]